MLDLIRGRGRIVFASCDAFNYLDKVFRFVGLTPAPPCRFLYVLYGSLTAILILLSPFIFNVGWIRDRHILSIREILNCVQAALNVIGIPIKSVVIVLSLRELRSVEPLLVALDARYSAAEDLAKIRHCVIIGNRIVFGYIFSYLLYETLTVIAALLSGYAPLTLWIPYLDWHRSRWEYWLQVSFDAYVLFYILMYQVINDAYAGVYIYIIRTQVQLLANRVKRLGTAADKSADETYNELQDCIVTHQEILSVLRIVEPLISATLFVQFLIAAAIISTTLVNILIFADATSRVAALSYMYCVLLQTAPTCFYATYLQSDCEQLSMSIFHSNWIAQGKRFNKLLIYFLHRAQYNMPLLALKFVPIDLTTNLSIAKFSFSLYMFIKKMGVGEKMKN